MVLKTTSHHANDYTVIPNSIYVHPCCNKVCMRDMPFRLPSFSRITRVSLFLSCAKILRIPRMRLMLSASMVIVWGL